MKKKNGSSKRLALGIIVLMIGASIVQTMNTVVKADPTEGLVGYWSFDDQANPGYDDSGNDKNGVLKNGTTWISAGKVNGALEFDGVNDCVDLPDNNFKFQTFSISCWASCDTFGYFPPIFSVNNRAAYGGWVLEEGVRYSGNTINFLTATGAGTEIDILKSQPIMTSHWYHIVGVKTPSYMRLYIDGQLIAEDTSVSPVVYTGCAYGDTFVPFIGCTLNVHIIDRYFDGKIDEVRVYDRALTSSEVQLLYGTVANADDDYDGLKNSWELNGIDSNEDGIIDLDLPALGANYQHKDLFVEVDAMVGRVPFEDTLNRVIDAFADVPNSLVNNPDGLDGINLHVQLDDVDIPLEDFPNVWTEFDSIKDEWFGTANQRADSNWENMEDAKKMVYRYCIFANTHSSGRSSGYAELPGNDFMVTLGAWSPAGGDEDQQAGTFMHEFGHNLGLRHGGGDDDNCKPNYHSIMNYLWQVPNDNYQSSWILDYSCQAFPDLNEAHLIETVGIGGHNNHQVPIGPILSEDWDTPLTIVNEAGPIDYNGDGDNTDSAEFSRDLNHFECIDKASGPSPGQLLRGYEDWSHLRYQLSGDPNFSDGVHVGSFSEEMTYDDYVQFNFFDDTSPGVILSVTPNMLWPPNNEMRNVLISGSATDEGSGIASIIFNVVDEYDIVEPMITDFGQTIQLQAMRFGYDFNGRLYTITATATDNFGNVATASTVVLVPHDLGY
jgi:hypothetical protein